MPPFQTHCITINSESFRVEIAETPAQKQKGLQHRTSLADNAGMVFPYEHPEQLTFWMKDCKIALDLLFFRNGVLVDFVDAAPPCTDALGQCPLYTSKVPADCVVELKAGTRKKYHWGLNTPLSGCSKN